jgi:hypothetical protein
LEENKDEKNLGVARIILNMAIAGIARAKFSYFC